LCIGLGWAYTLMAQVYTIENLHELDLPPSLMKQQGKGDVRWVENVVQHMREDGFLLSGSETIIAGQDSVTLRIIPGKRYTWAHLSTDSIDTQLLSAAGLKKFDPDGAPVSYQEIAAAAGQLLTYAEEHGFPFATVELCRLNLEDTVLSASLCLQLNRFIRFDTLMVLGNSLLSAHYLEIYTGIQPGQPYQESLVRDLDDRLDELSFVRRTQPSVLRFSGNQAKAVMYLDVRNASKFDLIVGFLPNNEITGRLIVTGQGTLDLRNVFGQGERLGIQFSKLESTTKSLQTQFSYPYLPALPLGIDASFDLFLKDSTFLERNADVGVLYTLGADHYLKALVRWYNSDVLTYDSLQVLTSKSLPAQLDVQLRSYGLEWGLSRLDYSPNPRKGWMFSVTGMAGTRTIRRNASILQLEDPADPSFDFATLYDSLDERSLTVQYAYDLQYVWPLSGSFVWMMRARGASQINPAVYANELYRIGGNQLLRGFDEQSVLASDYHILTLEPRYLLSRNAYAGVFTDVGWIANRSLSPVVNDLPVGFGAIFTFETKAGVFGLTYALGTRQDAPVLVRNAKIHFGYINYF